MANKAKPLIRLWRIKGVSKGAEFTIKVSATTHLEAPREAIRRRIMPPDAYVHDIVLIT